MHLRMSGKLASGNVEHSFQNGGYFTEAPAPEYVSWQKLQQLYDAEHSKISLFAQDPKLFFKFSKEYNVTSGPDTTMLVDLSKNL